MLNRFRPWQLALLVIGLCLLGVGAAVYFRSVSSLSTRQLLSYLDRTDSTLIFVDVRALRVSGILNQLAGSALSEEAEYKDFVRETGFNYKQDLDRILSSSYDDKRLFLLEGRFDWKNLTAYATRQGGACKNGFCRVPSSKPNRTVSFYPVNRRLMALAFSNDEWAASELKARPRREDPFALPAQPLWASVPPAALRDANLPAGARQFAKSLEGAERVILTIGPSDGRFEVRMDVTCKSPEEAAILRTQLEALTNILKRLIEREKQVPSSADLSGVLTSGVFERMDRRVLGKWPVEKTFLNSLADGG